MILFLIAATLKVELKKINVKIDNDVYSLVNVYAPNDINEKINFLKS